MTDARHICHCYEYNYDKQNFEGVYHREPEECVRHQVKAGTRTLFERFRGNGRTGHAAGRVLRALGDRKGILHMDDVVRLGQEAADYVPIILKAHLRANRFDLPLSYDQFTLLDDWR